MTSLKRTHSAVDAKATVAVGLHLLGESKESGSVDDRVGGIDQRRDYAKHGRNIKNILIVSRKKNGKHSA